ncbi:MAG TPA: ATP-binding protein [Sedimentisphaerales bacterium]|jgi:signal transduction histidine kinase|nr:ATP-binding protein [Sedimentisphaerales bacterium]HOH63707.1 ATP-binding protein [Sedimentisphaerales bacterium]HQA92208.1 ATP-binding protein [Sedimentisphaerales bacterium]HQN32214.1 ATP-binding protein [Sedimentisphaerales bacterium]
MMRIDLRESLQRVLRFLHLTPLSLAEKCRIMFGAAVLFSLSIALLLPYIWMSQLTKKVLLDTNKMRVESVLLRTHFQLEELSRMTRPELNSQGAMRDPNEPGVLWIPLRGRAGQEGLERLNNAQRRLFDELIADETRDDGLELNRVDGRWRSDYVRLFRATETCVSCHNVQGSAGAFALHEVVGVAAVRARGIGSDLRKTVFLNRVWTVIAGLIGATGAMVAFYWITQRVILRPIRQLRALANNVAEGNLDIRSVIATADEYERLSEAFNHMLDNLQAAQENLHQANRQLDAKIAELSQRNIELYKANKLKSEFLANMSHEFRTPLNAILGFAQVLREKPGLLRRDKGQRYAENIISSGNSLLAMINDLLDLAKVQAGRMELRIEPVSLPQLCESLVSAFTLLAKKKRIRIRTEVDPDVPILVTDGGKVQQVLYNFLSNAVKFTPARGSIEIRAEMLDADTVRIAVTDTGCGIAESDRETIFEKFRQVDGSLTRETPGSGLGLSICKELAQMLAGTIGLESQVDVGSTFWLDIPARLSPGEETSLFDSHMRATSFDEEGDNHAQEQASDL